MGKMAGWVCDHHVTIPLSSQMSFCSSVNVALVIILGMRIVDFSRYRAVLDVALFMGTDGWLGIIASP
ncbi:MAG: hypothetical protein ACR2OA_04935 [Rubripirellula sp.]